MRNCPVLVFLCMVVLLLGASSPPPPWCDAPPLSDQQVKNIIDKERVTRTDLPPPFPEYRWFVRRSGRLCHYLYREYAAGELHNNQTFTLSPHGVIVDARRGRRQSFLQCPEKVFTESELAEIIKKEREKRSYLPPPFPNYKTRVSRSGCLYLYSEYNVPEKRGDYLEFTIDPFGELMDFSRNRPY